mgnify:FL=1
MKNSTCAVRDYLEREYPRFVSVPELISVLHQTDIRKRVSELIAEKVPIEKERRGRFTNYRYAGEYQRQSMMAEYDQHDRPSA